MGDILKNTRLAWLTGGSSEEPDRSAEAGGEVLDSSSPAVVPTAKSRLFKTVWVLGGLMTLLLPVVIRNAKLNNFQNRSWASAAAAANQGGNYGQQGAYFRDVNDCKWYKWGCTPYYVDERGEYVSEYHVSSFVGGKAVIMCNGTAESITVFY